MDKNKILKKKNILIITREMLPYVNFFGNCQRMHYLANFLSEKGCNVYVMAQKVDCKNLDFKGIKKSYKNCWIRRVDLSKSKLLNSEYMKKLSKKMLNEISEMYAFQHYFWMIFNRKRILNYIKQRNIEVVIISGPCFSIFKIGVWIKRKYKNVRVILDYRDPWNLWNDGHDIAEKYEYKCIMKSDKVVCFSDDFKHAMIDRFPAPPDIFEVVYNGFSDAMWKGVRAQNEKGKCLVIKYIGSIDFPIAKGHYRNPANLIRAFLKICENRNILLQFVGVRNITRQMLDVQAKSKSKITFTPTVPVKKALCHMMEADVLVILHDAGNMVDKYILNAKLFDYMRSGKFIFNIGNKDSALSRFVENNELGITCVNEQKNIEKQLCDLYDQWIQNGGCIERPNKDVEYSKYSREYQNENYFNIIQSL